MPPLVYFDPLNSNDSFFSTKDLNMFQVMSDDNVCLKQISNGIVIVPARS